MKPKVYLAGPDVFRKDNIQFFEALKKYVASFGFEPLSPFDNAMDPNAAPSDNAKMIFKGDASMVQRCDAIMANVEPFRGPSCDSGTAWEIGGAYSLGKVVVMYNVPTDQYHDRAVSYRSKKYPSVEDFQQSDNLMIAQSGPGFQTMDEALHELQRIFNLPSTCSGQCANCHRFHGVSNENG